jgi:hypothetical protein
MESPDGSDYNVRNWILVLYDKNHVSVEFISYFILFCLNTFDHSKKSARECAHLIINCKPVRFSHFPPGIYMECEE